LVPTKDGSRRLTYAILTDPVGTPRELVTPEGEIAWQARTDLWGAVQEIKREKTDCPLRFQGQYHDDESDLHYNHQRYYDPGTGRYLTPDPLGLAGGDSAYAYVANPLAAVDPLGLMGCDGRATTASFNPNEIRFSQKTASYNKIDRETGQSYTYDDLVESMRSNGWLGDPIDVIKMPDGKITSIDNTRVAAAREAMIDVKATVRGYDEPLTPAVQEARGWQNYSTWGEVINARIKQQGSTFSADNPCGSYQLPRITGRP